MKYGFTVFRAGQSVDVAIDTSDLQESIQLARRNIEQLLGHEKNWGLVVITPCGGFGYGQFPRGGSGGPANEKLLRIRRRWKDGSNWHSAFENAVQIIRAC